MSSSFPPLCTLHNKFWNSTCLSFPSSYYPRFRIMESFSVLVDDLMYWKSVASDISNQHYQNYRQNIGNIYSVMTNIVWSIFKILVSSNILSTFCFMNLWTIGHCCICMCQMLLESTYPCIKILFATTAKHLSCLSRTLSPFSQTKPLLPLLSGTLWYSTLEDDILLLIKRIKEMGSSIRVLSYYSEWRTTKSLRREALCSIRSIVCIIKIAPSKRNWIRYF